MRVGLPSGGYLDARTPALPPRFHRPFRRRPRRGVPPGAPAGAGAAVAPKIEGETAWYDVTGVEGKGWSDTARFFDRLPSRAEGKVRADVWNLSRHSAGMLARFETDSTAIRARYRLLNASLAMPHMPATGVSGLDLYARDEQGRERRLGVAQPHEQHVEATLADGVDPHPGGPRRYTLYLPLYNGVETLEIGVAAPSTFRPVPPRKDKPLVFYGTSIMQGGCASRPGMSITALLGRRLDRPTINLGFSGNGRMEPEVGVFLAELDPAAYVIDCLPNMTPELVVQNAAPLVRQLRQARPSTPILLVEDRTFTNAAFSRAQRAGHAARRAALHKAYDELTAAGVPYLHYLPGSALLGDDGEAAVDGSHPTDVGMLRYANAYEPLLRSILEGK